MKKIFQILIFLTPISIQAQTTYNSAYPAGGLKLSTSLSSTLQTVKDKAGNNSILKISTQRIALGNATSIGLINLPDSTNAANGIQFGTGTANLYRSSSSTLKTDGNLLINGVTYINSELSNLLTGIVRSGQSIHIQGNTLTGSQSTPAINVVQTLNTTGNPDIFNLDITNTASGTNSNIAHWKVGGSTRFRVKINGDMTMGGSSDFGIGTGLGAFFRYNLSIGSLSYPVASAILECASTTKGFLPPRMTTAQRVAIPSPANGLEVTDTDMDADMKYSVTLGKWIGFRYNGITSKFQGYDGTNWIDLN